MCIDFLLGKSERSRLSNMKVVHLIYFVLQLSTDSKFDFKTFPAQVASIAQWQSTGLVNQGS